MNRAVSMVLTCLLVVSCGSDKSPSTKELFGLRKVLVETTRSDGVVLVAGLAPGRYIDRKLDDLILGGGVRRDGQLQVRLLDPMPSNYDDGRGCRAEVAPKLNPAGPVIVAGCITGGTNRFGYIAVLGVSAVTRDPVIHLVMSCGPTNWKLTGRVLEVLSPPGPPIHLTWDNGQLGPTFDDVDEFNHCAERSTSLYGDPTGEHS